MEIDADRPVEDDDAETQSLVAPIRFSLSGQKDSKGNYRQADARVEFMDLVAQGLRLRKLEKHGSVNHRGDGHLTKFHRLVESFRKSSRRAPRPAPLAAPADWMNVKASTQKPRIGTVSRLAFTDCVLIYGYFYAL